MSSSCRLAFLVAVCAPLFPVPATSQESEVPLRSGNKLVTAQSTGEFLQRVRQTPGGLHGLAVFRDAPTTVEKQQMASRGVVVLSRLTRYAYLVRARQQTSLGGLLVRGGVPQFAALEGRERVDPAVWTGRLNSFAYRDSSGVDRNLVLNVDGSLNLLVRFHEDVADARADSVLRLQTVATRRVGWKRWEATVTKAQMQQLAENDLVRWVDAQRPTGGSHIDGVRDEIGVSTLQMVNLANGIVSGLNGSGITVGVYDKGVGPHGDFGIGDASRVIDEPESSGHGTAMAGLIAGDGLMSSKSDNLGIANGGSPWQYRGIAPAARILDAREFVKTETGHGDLLRKHIVSNEMDISNHAYGVSLDGFYGSANHLHDGIIRGDDAGDGVAIPPRLHVHSAGNVGRNFDPLLEPPPARKQRGFFSLGNQLKNGLVVGNWYSFGNRLTKNSGLGPTHDGRIKPDVVAPGAFVVTPGYCTSADNSAYTEEPLSVGTDPAGPFYPCYQPAKPLRTDFYYQYSGTSVAAAVTTGMLALVLQEMKNLGADLDLHPPLPSTLRAIAIHTADDVVALAPWYDTDEGLPVQPWAGPDFITGFGMINAASAVDLTHRRAFREGIVAASCEVRTYNVFVPALGPDSVSVTLAWDDPANDVEISFDKPLLVNDLDLVLIDPLGGVHYPWSVDQVIKTPGSPPSGGVTLTDAQQSCNTQIQVERQWSADATVYIDPTVTTTKDNIPNAVLTPKTGRDHLNNVEQVKTPSLPGWWKAQVSAFHLGAGPQSFSLAGVPPQAQIMFMPQTVCKKFPGFCMNPLKKLCLMSAVLCDKNHFIAVNNRRTLSLSFASPHDRKIVPVSSLCFALRPRGDCLSDSSRLAPAGASGTGRPRAREIVLGPTASGIGAEIFDGEGNVVARDVTRSQSKRLRIPAGAGELFLVIQPTRAMAVSRPQEVRAQLIDIR